MLTVENFLQLIGALKDPTLEPNPTLSLIFTLGNIIVLVLRLKVNFRNLKL